MVHLAIFTIFVSATATFIAVALAVGLAFWIVNSRNRSERAFLVVSQALNATPPTVVGIFFYYLCTKFHPMQNLLFTPLGMIVGQIILGLPIAYFLFAQLISNSMQKVVDLGLCSVSGKRRLRNLNLLWTVILDIRTLIIPTSFIVFGRLVGEVGAILIIGGAIRGKTETLSTNIVMQTQMGDVEQALASGGILLAIVVVARLVALLFEKRKVF